MLTDNVINVLQRMLEQMLTNAMRLQDTLLGQSLTYDVYKKNPLLYKSFITVDITGLLSLHTGASTAKYLYWIVSSSTHC